MLESGDLFGDPFQTAIAASGKRPALQAVGFKGLDESTSRRDQPRTNHDRGARVPADALIAHAATADGVHALRAIGPDTPALARHNNSVQPQRSLVWAAVRKRPALRVLPPSHGRLRRGSAVHVADLAALVTALR